MKVTYWFNLHALILNIHYDAEVADASTKMDSNSKSNKRKNRGDFVRNPRKNTPSKENDSEIVKKFKSYSQQYDAVVRVNYMCLVGLRSKEVFTYLIICFWLKK